VIIAFTLVLKHELEMADQCSVGAGWNSGLVHMKRTGKASRNGF
jgi:hypothetical protein